MTSEAESLSPRRRPKGDKRARTRARIIQAAAELVQETGFDGATVQAVAKRAGLSNGAIYGNFKDRDDLFAAIGPTYWPRIRPEFAPGSSFAEKMQAMAEATIAALPLRRSMGSGRLTGLAYALGNEALRVRLEQTAAERYVVVADWWRSVADEGPLPMPPDVLVRVLNALTEGLTLQWLLTPELITDEVVHAAFAALAPKRSDE